MARFTQKKNLFCCRLVTWTASLFTCNYNYTATVEWKIRNKFSQQNETLFKKTLQVSLLSYQNYHKYENKLLLSFTAEQTKIWSIRRNCLVKNIATTTSRQLIARCTLGSGSQALCHLIMNTIISRLVNCHKVHHQPHKKGFKCWFHFHTGRDRARGAGLLLISPKQNSTLFYFDETLSSHIPPCSLSPM